MEIKTTTEIYTKCSKFSLRGALDVISDDKKWVAVDDIIEEIESHDHCNNHKGRSECMKVLLKTLSQL